MTTPALWLWARPAAHWAWRLASGTTGLALLLAALAWWRQWSWGVLFYLVVGLPYLVLAGLVMLAVGVLWPRPWRTRVQFAAALGLCLLVPLGTQAPLWFAQKPPQTLAQQRTLTVMSINMQFGAADAPTLVATVQEHQVDVLAIQELTAPAWNALRAAGLDALLPHQFAQPGPQAQGSALASRYPLAQTSVWPGYYMTNLSAQVQLPDGAGFTLVGAHPAYPVTRALWYREAQQLRRDLAVLDGPVIVAGDFNATLDQPPLRTLAREGYIAVQRQAGAGWVRTWGPRTDGLSLVGIDHVLVRGGPWGLDMRAVRIPGSDHRAVVAQVGLSLA